MTADDFKHQPHGPYLFNFWHATPRVSTPFGDFVVEAHMPLKDTDPPDADMVCQANELAEFTRMHSDLILDMIYENYQDASDEPEWMENCGVPLGLTRDALAPTWTI